MVACGHTHKLENTYDKTVNGKTITICAAGSTGAPWKGLILSDGCQRGYKVYEYENNSVKRELYKSIQYEEPFQMRMFPPPISLRSPPRAATITPSPTEEPTGSR